MARAQRPPTKEKKRGRGQRKKRAKCTTENPQNKSGQGSQLDIDELPPDPMTLYITAIPSISIEKVEEMYGGRHGCSAKHLRGRSREEGWTAKRKKHRERVDTRTLEHAVETQAMKIANANAKHIEFGRQCREKAAELLESVNDKKKVILKPVDALRIAAMLGDKGVSIERKGLGLADKFVHVRVIREATFRFVEVLRRHLSMQPDLMEVVVAEFETVLTDAEKDAATQLHIDDD